MIRITEIKLHLDEEESLLKNKISEKLNIPVDDIITVQIIKKSIDARKSEIYFTYSLNVDVKDELSVLKLAGKNTVYKAPVAKSPLLKRNTQKLRNNPVIVGAGPAGLFAALHYIYMGYKPVILERGNNITERKKDVNSFWKSGGFNQESNVHFGLGGAGTFSDGKLTSGINDELCRNVLEEFVSFGAPQEILYSNKPHIGTDHLQKIVRNMCSKITDKGGIFKFNAKLSDMVINDGKICAVITDKETIECDGVILAIGNCARDTFEMLYNKGVEIVRKNFAIGVRIEHPRKIINAAQYKKYAGHPKLGAADYRLVNHSPNYRSAYSFCMCPGGYVIPSSSEPCTVATNGMSEYSRKAANSNSAIIVPVGAGDFESNHPLAGIQYQRKLEKAAFEAGGSNYYAPVQLVKDFIAEKPSISLGNVIPTYIIGFRLTDINALLPEFISAAIREAIKNFSKKIKGFMMDEAILTGIETHTSSPVRIMRNKKYESNIKNLYPAGEGSGYAGGIMSSAVDGIKAARASVALE